ncbi:MAG: hypothetical protein KC649_04980 [Candidatus Omnitrophica bacterium]|nr:hypothetical protein [Candidatus Omnitrophota bacterium]
MTKIDLADFFHASTPDDDHLDPLTAEDYLCGRVEDARRSDILRHLTDCKECRVRLASLKDVREYEGADDVLLKSDVADHVRAITAQICSSFGKHNVRSEIYFVFAVVSIGLSFVWPSRFWQFLTISLILTVRFAVLRLEAKRFLKIERTIRSERLSDNEGSDLNQERTRNL